MLGVFLFSWLLCFGLLSCLSVVSGLLPEVTTILHGHKVIEVGSSRSLGFRVIVFHEDRQTTATVKSVLAGHFLLGVISLLDVSSVVLGLDWGHRLVSLLLLNLRFVQVDGDQDGGGSDLRWSVLEDLRFVHHVAVELASREADFEVNVA